MVSRFTGSTLSTRIWSAWPKSAGVKGKFLMLLNDHTEVFKEFQIRPVQLKYSANNGRQRGRNALRQELLISNF